MVRRTLPGFPISVSHEVAPIWREYERDSTTIADAYLEAAHGALRRRAFVGAWPEAGLRRRGRS